MFKGPLAYFKVLDKTNKLNTMFIPLKYLYPECTKLIESYPKMYPLRCLKDNGCPADQGCMDILAKRVLYLFEQVDPSCAMLVAYYTYRDTKSLRGAVFQKDNKLICTNGLDLAYAKFNDPQILTINKSAFSKLQKDGKYFSWDPTPEYINFGLNRAIIPVSNILK